MAVWLEGRNLETKQFWKKRNCCVSCVASVWVSEVLLSYIYTEAGAP